MIIEIEILKGTESCTFELWVTRQMIEEPRFAAIGQENHLIEESRYKLDRKMMWHGG